jgi:hypothetical protein
VNVNILASTIQALQMAPHKTEIFSKNGPNDVDYILAIYGGHKGLTK